MDLNNNIADKQAILEKQIAKMKEQKETVAHARQEAIFAEKQLRLSESKLRLCEYKVASTQEILASHGFHHKTDLCFE